MTEIAVKYDLKHIGIEATNEKSKTFAEKLGFLPVDKDYYVVAIEDLISYFQNID